MEIPDQLRAAASGSSLITLEDGGNQPMEINGTPASPGGTGDDPDYTTISGGKRRQCVMEMENFPCGILPGTPDSPYTTAVRGCFAPMDNGEHLLTQDAPGRPSHFITD